MGAISNMTTVEQKTIMGQELELDESWNTLNEFINIAKISESIISEWRSGKSKRVEEKINANGAKDVVTQVDRSIEQVAVQRLGMVYPDVRVFGEENFDHDFGITETERYFVIDPIDGTTQFIRGNNEWSISICEVVKGRPHVAMVYMPDNNEMFTAIKDSGVFLNGIPLDLKNDENTRRVGVSPGQIELEEFRARVVKTSYEPVYVSALTPKICSILRGDISAATYFEQAGKSASLWDYAAVHLLIHESGGRMTSLCGSEMPFSGEEVIHTKGWLASSDQLEHRNLLNYLAVNKS